MMVLLYGYATGVFSSRKIARTLHEDVAFRVLAAANFPAHRTIRDFRALHLKELSELFVQVVRLSREMGLVNLGTIAVDGTKVKANASRHKAMSYERMVAAERELKTQIDALLERARRTDEAEKNEPELDIPAEITRRALRLAAIAQARGRLEQRQREADLQRGRDPVFALQQALVLYDFYQERVDECDAQIERSLVVLAAGKAYPQTPLGKARHRTPATQCAEL